MIELICVVISYLILLRSRKIYTTKSKEVGPFSKEAAYINRQAMDRAAGKDIRIFQMQDLFLAKYNHAIKGMNKVYDYIHNNYIVQGIITNITVFISYILPHGYLLYLLMVNKILTVSEFVLYSGLIGQFSSQFYSMLSCLRGLNPVSASIEHIRRFLDMEESRKTGEGIGQQRLAEMMTNGVQIKLRGVSYTYPGKDTATLKNLNLVIQPNEKLALIGLNGAGKTTLVKLLCGFYQPTEGEILINDIPASNFSAEEHETLISALFQDSMVLPLTLDENLTGAQQEKIDKEYLKKMLNISGFLTRYSKLSLKGDTLLVREVNENATDFSGGEKQKLFFARALYKKAPLLILDEPTAALDPIAENELYQKYGEASQNRTSIFISHRLSSTRFCDRIILLEDAQIKEEGTHEELMSVNGRYAELYELQSNYYKGADAHKEESDENAGMD